MRMRGRGRGEVYGAGELTLEEEVGVWFEGAHGDVGGVVGVGG